jgi:hypothetical protein
VQARLFLSLLLSLASCAAPRPAGPAGTAPVAISSAATGTAAIAPIAATAPPLAPPSSLFTPMVVGPSGLTLHGLEDGVVAVAEETTDPGKPSMIPIGLVRGAGVDFAEPHWLAAGVTEVTAVGGRLSGPLFLSKRYDTGPALPATLKLGQAGWRPVTGRASGLSLGHVFSSGSAWIGTIHDPWGQSTGFVTIEGATPPRDWVKDTCPERFQQPLRPAGVATAQGGALLVAGADCSDRPRLAIWPAGQRAPSSAPSPPGADTVHRAARLADGIALLTNRGVFTGGPAEWTLVGAPDATRPAEDLAVVGGSKLFVVQDHRVSRWEGAAFVPLPLPLDLPVTSLAATDTDLYAASGPVLFRLGEASVPTTPELSSAMYRLLELSPVKRDLRSVPRPPAPPSCPTPLVLLAPASPFLPEGYDFPASRERLAKPVKGFNDQVFGPYDVVVVQAGEPRARWLAVRAGNPFTAFSVASTEDFPTMKMTCEALAIERVVATVPRASD